MLAASKGQKLYYHKLGDRSRSDVLIYERRQPEWYVRGEVSDDGTVPRITIAKGTTRKNRLYCIDLG